MIRIEIWKSKPSWHVGARNEKEMIIKRLARVVEATLPIGAQQDGGPFVIKQAEGVLLVWAWGVDEIESVVESTSIGLNEYFEPLTYMAATGNRTAKALAEKLAV
jgi:hypothetical protein